MKASCDLAIGDWVKALGAAKVSVEERVLDAYARTTLVKGTRPACILYPESVDDVRAIVQIACQHNAVVYPISRGRNWGYGDACAPTDGVAIVDLGRMNRIIEVNTELAYAVLEPGVTQGQLFEHLTTHKTGLWFDCTGAGFEASVVGNTVDRGFGHTRYGDHFLTTCGMEVVLADGRVLETGFGHYANAKAARVYRYGIGPSLDGLFCQSNYGIVTKIGLWLMPQPEAFNFFYITVPREEDLTTLVDRLRPLRLNGLLTSAVHIANDLRLLSANGRYPWDLTNGKTPLSEEVRRRLRGLSRMGMWNAAGSLTGMRAHVRASRKALRRAVGNVGHVGFVGDGLLQLGRKAIPWLRAVGLGARLTEQLRVLEPNYGLLKGTPTDEPLLGAQWRLRRPPGEGPGDPRNFGCGLLWLSPVLPMTGRDAEAVVRIAQPLFARFAFEPFFTFTMINERAMVCVLNVVFDKAEVDETARAAECYDALADALIREGYLPYRTGPQTFQKLRRQEDVFWQVTSEIKRTLDPQDILARGRYIVPLE